MREATQTHAADEAEMTLVQPRFDDDDAMTAQPVVPLTERAAAQAAAAVGARPRARRPLPFVLLLGAALVGGLLSVLAYRLYQQRAQTPAEQSQQTITAPSPETPQAAPVEEAAASAPDAAQPSPTVVAEDDSQPSDASDASVTQPRAETARAEHDAGRREEAARTREDTRASEAAAAARAARRAEPEARREPERPRRVEVITEGGDPRNGEEASDYETRDERRARRRAARRNNRRNNPRNIDRLRAIFEGDPPR